MTTPLSPVASFVRAAPVAASANEPTPLPLASDSRPTVETLAARARSSLAGTSLADRVTPETLAALLRMSPEGSLDLDAEGRVQLRDPGGATREDEIIFGAVRNAMASSEPVGGPTGADADFVQAVTGYRRVELGGGLHTYVDAQGEGAEADSPVWQLGPLLDGQRRAGLLAGDLDRGWFQEWTANLPKEAGLPPEWLTRAEEWFNAREARG